MTKRKRKTEKQKCFDRCENLWKEICLKRAGYKSEISGKNNNLVVHHIARKPNYALRFSTENGIVLTGYEHYRGIHGEREEEYREKIKAAKGQNIYERMNKLRHISSPNIFEIEQGLLRELERISEF